MVAGNWRWICVRPEVLVSLVLLSAATCRAGLPTADWLPSDVKFHLSIVDYPQSKPLFDQTGFGQLLHDEAMRPFLKDVPNQLRSRAQSSWLGLMWVDLGVDWDRFRTVPSGEVAWAAFNINDTPAAILFADVTGKDEDVELLRKDIAAAMARKQVTPRQQDVDGTTITIYDLPERGDMSAGTYIHFVRDCYFVATPHIELVKRMMKRIGVEQADNLSGLATYQQVLGECRKASKDQPHALAYMVPLDCTEMLYKVAEERAAEERTAEEGIGLADDAEEDVKTPPEIFRSLGLDALAAVGATIVFGGSDTDFSFYASLYAPKPWSKSMQMFDLRNGDLKLEDWIDQGISVCALLNVHAKSVYSNLGPLFDEVAAQGMSGTWEELLDAMREDEDGPGLDMEKEIFPFLTGPAVVIESESLPINPESPQVLMAIKANNVPAIEAGFKKAMQDDPYVEKRMIGGTRCYCSFSEDNEDRLLWVMCAAHGHLFLANDFDFLTPVLKQEVGPPIAKDPALQKAQAGWKEDLATDPSTILFYRLDQWAEVRYELARAGKRVAAHKTFNGLLTGFLGGELMEDDEQREIDGAKLPPFEQVRRYFGTFDAAAVTVENGWLVSGHVRPR